MKILNTILLAAIATTAATSYAGGNPAASKVISDKTCQACHGADGNSTDPQYPRLAGQYANYLERALEEYKSGDRSNPIMSGFAAGLSEEDIKNVSAWFASQSGLHTPVEPRTVAD